MSDMTKPMTAAEYLEAIDDHDGTFRHAVWPKDDEAATPLQKRILAALREREEALAQLSALRQLAEELWSSRRASAYGPSGERAMLAKYPWLAGAGPIPEARNP